MNQPPDPQQQLLEVELPAGGRLHMQTAEEVELWEISSERFKDDYALEKTNDLVLVGALLSQQVTLYRAQQRLSGMEPEFDASGVATGRYVKSKLKPADEAAAQATITKASAEIRELEKSLGIDKKTREAGGTQSVGNYIQTLKLKAHAMGVHIANRLKEYERVMMEARWKLRLLENGDPEDRAYHNLTEESFLKWLREEIDGLEQTDRQFAHEKGKVFIGKI